MNFRFEVFQIKTAWLSTGCFYFRSTERMGCGIIKSLNYFFIQKIKTMSKKNIFYVSLIWGVCFFMPFSVRAGWSLANIEGYGLPDRSISEIINNLLSWLLMMFGVVGVIGFVIAGITYLVAAGNDDMISRAKTAMQWSIVGVIVGLGGLVVIKALEAMLNADSFF